MTKGIVSTFPSLLNEYNDSSEILFQSPKTQQQPSHKENKVIFAKEPRKQEVTFVKSPRQFHHHSPKRSTTPGEKKRINRLKQVEGERLERVADTWDQAKAEVLQERHDQLNQKLVLQHALIKAQDRQASLIRKEEEELRLRKRDEEKKRQQEKVAALQDRCKQSLAIDRKSKRKPQSSDTHGRASDRQTAEEDMDRLSESSSPLSGSMDSGSVRRERTKRPGHHGYLPSDSYAPATSPMRELREDEDEEAEFDSTRKEKVPDGVVTPADLSSVPWHHAQLYKMYGRNADYYIHPKMQPEKQKIVNPTLKSQKGHLGASHIWNTLRSDSTNKLLRTDRRFPQELKDAFSSHVREGITKHKKPVFRNFTVTEDVPNIDRLMDQSLLRRIRVLRHKTELMYRSSVTNHDRTEILLFSNPLPSVTEGEEGIGKYLPSWDDNVSDDTDATFMRWFKNKKQGDNFEEEQQALTGGEEEEEGDENAPPTELKKRHPMSVLSPVGSDVSDSLQSIWHSIMTRQRPRKEPKYHFLTEEEARSQGEFLMKMGMEKDKIDRGRTDLLPQLPGHGDPRRSLPSIKAMSAMESRNMRHSVAGHSQSRSESAQNSNHSRSSRFESRWQPLSMNALVEYKEQLATEGQGDFQQGRPKMWNLTTASQE